MSKTYYVIELTPKWLAILLVGLAALLVVAFAGGYGAAWSTLGGTTVANAEDSGRGEEDVAEVEVVAPEGSEIVASEATPDPPKPTVTPIVEKVEATPTPLAQPEPTATPEPTAVPTVAVVKPTSRVQGFKVQVLASTRIQAIEKARRQLVDAGFPNSEHEVVETRVAGGGILLKLRIGPFPDHESAERVMRRMQAAGFPDAWVVRP